MHQQVVTFKAIVEVRQYNHNVYTSQYDVNYQTLILHKTNP